jgi:hypothetical protein
MRAAIAICFLGLGFSQATYAQRLKSFPNEASEQNSSTQKPKSDSKRPSTFTEAPENTVPVEKPFDFRPIGFTLLAFLVVAPFAWKVYQQTASQQEGFREASRVGRPRSRPKIDR